MALGSNSWGALFIASLIDNGSLDLYYEQGDCKPLFEHRPFENEMYDWFAAFISMHRKLPAKQTFEEETGEKLPVPAEPAAFYRQRIKEQHIHRELVLSNEIAAQHLHKKDPVSALGVIVSMVEKVTGTSPEYKVHNFKDAHDLVVKSISDKITGANGTCRLGWPTVDEQSDGLRKGDVVSFVGRPGQGKTFLLLNAALNIWKDQKKSVLVISMEMPTTEIFERLAVMNAKMPYDWIKTGGFPTLHSDKLSLFKDTMKAFIDEESNLYVVDTQLTATVGDIRKICSRVKPDVVIVDGAYLLRAEGRFSKSERVGEICSQLKMLAMDQGVSVIASWQFNRESTKVKAVGLEHIAGSDEIGQLSSLVLGLFEDDTVETINTRKIQILKGRTGETGCFYTNWCFNSMNFDEVTVDNAVLVD